MVLGMGLFVYETKRPVTLPPEVIDTSTPELNTGPGTQWFGGDDDDDDDDFGGSTLPVNTATPTPPKQTSVPTSTPTPSGITLAQVALHNSRSSCWSAINGNVYDLTSWITNHPGGENNILIICGKDGSGAYNNQHGGSSKTESILVGFKIGTLAR